MSMHQWYSEKPIAPKYLQISHQGLGRFFKETGKDFSVFRDKIHDHHAQPVTKDGMFILESFFSGFVLDWVAEYLISEGFQVNPDYQNLEGEESMAVGYDGVLVLWMW